MLISTEVWTMTEVDSEGQVLVIEKMSICIFCHVVYVGRINKK
ncbi:hypothetical protein P22_1467 [Propionispora sp. 2/2-37]|nr:hypothetical protein P22_1467 [Propionispora sp. 2/2-37]